MAVVHILLALVLLSTTYVCSSLAVPSSDAVLIVVDQSGKGDYRTIQGAINAVASNNSELVYISIKPGIYRFVSFKLNFFKVPLASPKYTYLFRFLLFFCAKSRIDRFLFLRFDINSTENHEGI
ncbi:putative pectinesterase [Helianthus annuus]|nr:putative pectinesterase [Helianthus annuus]KAJ0505731.1 putative pectinesterase [Helianthus annuus]KAJ0675400.1 putative pectinesterase [Helianthus annuus]KAJ0678695.1 putative pectinesterase [Helianthus annuus]KAJ0725982.1 putative pectinesterase [Helianthus annuus]